MNLLDLHIENFHFADPFWLYFILLLPVAGVLTWWASRARHATLFLGNPRLVAEAPGVLSLQLIPWLLKLSVLALCLVAAARPQAGQKKVEEKQQVTDLFVALDLSGSMITADLKPNRVTAAKQMLSRFLDQVHDARVGLTVFAGISFTQCPLTSDMNVVKQLLSNVDLTSVKVDGTAIGDALVSSLNRLQNGSGRKGGAAEGTSGPSLVSKMLGDDKPAETQVPDSQAIILLTDGGDNASKIPPLTAAKIAASRGVRIYTIGVGTTESVPMVFDGPDGKTHYAVDPRTGGVAMSDPVDMVLLREIARLTGGRSYNASSTTALQDILDEIARMEKKDVVTTAHWEYQELASYFLLAAFLLLALDMGLEMTVLRTLP